MEEKILQAIMEADKIICLRHISPDGDAYGSAYGLGQVIKDNFPEKIVLFGGERLSYLDFLVIPDKITPSDYQGALVIITDTPIKSRVDGDGWEQAQKIIKIDHHMLIEKFGDIEWIEDHRIAVSEMIAQLVINSGWTITNKAAQLIFTGIVTDSNRFYYPSTTAQTLQLASKLMIYGADCQQVYENLYQESWKQFQFKNYLKSLIKFKKNIAHVRVTNEMLTTANITFEEAKPLVNIMANVKEFEIWVYFIENVKDHNINVSIRSKKIIINHVAQKFHGGGHRLASGCKISSWAEAEEVLAELSKLVPIEKE